MKKTQLYGIGGLIIGFLLGAILVGAAGEDLGLTGTASDANGNTINIELAPLDYYLVPIEEASAWLRTNYPDEADEVSDDLDAVNGLFGTADFGTYYAENQGSVENVLLTLQGLLFADVNPDVSTCVGINQDVYSGPGVYVYVQVPDNMADNVPVDWEDLKLDGPKEDTMLWSTQCLNNDPT